MGRALILVVGLSGLLGCTREIPEGPAALRNQPQEPAGVTLATALEGIVAELKTVHDEATAKAALLRLEALADSIDAIPKQPPSPITPGDPEATTPPRAEQQAEVDRERAAMEAYGDEVERIGAIEPARKTLEGFFRRVVP